MAEKLKNQNGAALALVLAMVIILGILGFAAMSVADNQTLMVNRHQQREKALHYAEAGVHHYMAELNEDFDFYTTQASDNMQNVDIAFEEGFYRLSIETPSGEAPYVTIRSTGWLQNSDIKRTIEVQFQKRSFLKNLINSSVGSDRYWYNNRFIRGDIINGPLHINADLITNGHTGEGFTGPIFNGPVTFSGKWKPEHLPLFTDDTTQFNAGLPQEVDRIAVPSSSENLKGKADYVFNGRTCINLDGSSVDVKDKDGVTTSISIPENGLIIYVKGASGNNKWKKETANVFISGVLDGRLTVVAENDIYITAADPTNWEKPGDSWTNPSTIENSQGGVTYAAFNNIDTISEDDIAGIANIDDMLGLMANRNVRILHYNWPKENGSWHGGSTLINWIDVAPVHMNIHASICAITGSFEYEEHSSGSAKGLLTVVGSITQYQIGPVAGYAMNLLDIPEEYDFLHSRISGYGKNYWHDPRLMYETPPSFLEPSNAGWEMIEWQEISNPVVAEPEP